MPTIIRSYQMTNQVFSYEPTFFGWPVWALRLARRLRDWLSRSIPSDTINVVEHIVDLGKIQDALFSVIDEFWKQHGRGPKYIVIGRKQIMELHLNMEPHEFFSIFKEYGKKKELFGVEVLIVPWMDGVLALPDIETLRKM